MTHAPARSSRRSCTSTRTLDPRAAAIARIEESLAVFRGFVKDRAVKPIKGPAEFEKFETDLLGALGEVARKIIAETMAAADVDPADVAIEIEGKTLRRVIRSKKIYMTAAGEVEVERWLHKDRTDEDARTVAAIEKRLGIVEGFWTPLSAKQALWMVTQMTPQKAEEAFERVALMQPSKSSLDRLPKGLSERWEENREQYEQTLRDALEVPEGTVTIAASIDGVLAPMEGTERTKKRAATAAAGKLTKGPAGYREVGCATLSFCDAKGDLIGAIRMARAPEHKKATVKKQLHAELLAVLAKRPDLRIVKVADGAEDNWGFLSEVLPEGVEIVDFFHAAEHLNVAVAAAYGDGTRDARFKFEELRDTLRDEDDGVDRVIRSLTYLRRKFPRKDAIKRELAYFKKHRARMRYREWSKAGLPIGSGVVEAACKTLVGQRLKLSGMRWGPVGAQAILTARGWDQSDRFDEAWALLAATYHAEVHVLSNVIPMFPEKRRQRR